MAYLMTDVAAGGEAALKLQQSMAAAPYVEQQTAAAVEETQLKLQQERLKAAYAPQEAAVKAQQDASNLEKSKFANIVTKAGIKLTDDKSNAVKDLMKDPEWSKKSFEDKSKAIVASWFNLDPASAADMQTAVNINSLKDSQARAAKNVEDYATLATANAVISGLPNDPTELGLAIDRLPVATKELLASKVGKDNWAKFTPAQKKEVISQIFKGPQQQLTEEFKAYHDNIQLEIAKLRKDTAIYVADEATRRKGTGSGSDSTKDKDKQEGVNFKNLITNDTKQQKIDEKENAPLQKAVEKASEDLATSKKGFLFDSDTPTEKAQIAYREAVDKLEASQRKQLKRRLATAKSAPSYDGKNEYVSLIQDELDQLPPLVKEEVDTHAKVDTTVAPPAKNVTSTKGNAGTKESPLPPPSDSSKLVDGMYYDLPGKGSTLYTKPKPAAPLVAPGKSTSGLPVPAVSNTSADTAAARTLAPVVKAGLKAGAETITDVGSAIAGAGLQGIKDKIANKQELTGVERAQAKRAGLLADSETPVDKEKSTALTSDSVDTKKQRVSYLEKTEVLFKNLELISKRLDKDPSNKVLIDKYNSAAKELNNFIRDNKQLWPQ